MEPSQNLQQEHAARGIPWGRVRSILFRLLVLFLWKTAAAPVEPVYQTDIGQQAAITLQDRSEIHLGGDTSISLSDASQYRTVRLHRGEIFAKVHHDNNRPFHVVVDHLIALDLGTAYDIATHDSTSNVSVLEGEVRLYQRDDRGQWIDPITAEAGIHRRVPAILGPGDLARIEQLSDGTIIVTRTRPDLGVATQRTQWLHGSLLANQQRLDEVIWQFNRYNHTQIVIDDPEVGALACGGAFNLDNVDGLIKGLRQLFHIDVEIVEGVDGRPSSYHLRNAAVKTSVSGRRRGTG